MIFFVHESSHHGRMHLAGSAPWPDALGRVMAATGTINVRSAVSHSINISDLVSIDWLTRIEVTPAGPAVTTMEEKPPSSH